MISTLKLTDEEKTHTISQGRMTYMQNRLSWCASYLKKAGLVYYPEKGLTDITDKGKQLLSENPTKIDNNFLRTRYKESDEFLFRRVKKTTKPIEEDDKVKELTPDEAFQYGYDKINETLADDILTAVKERSSKFFENLVVELLVKMGFGGSIKEAWEVIGKSGDGGIDGVIKEDKLGLDNIYTSKTLARW